MPRYYRALISLPITASDDTAAQREADELASRTINGHVELIGEVADGGFEIRRVVHSEALLLRQLPPDWKP